jgi:hypothetical protein
MAPTKKIKERKFPFPINLFSFTRDDHAKRRTSRSGTASEEWFPDEDPLIDRKSCVGCLLVILLLPKTSVKNLRNLFESHKNL